jgi:hypothetical protein
MRFCVKQAVPIKDLPLAKLFADLDFGGREALIFMGAMRGFEERIMGCIRAV